MAVQDPRAALQEALLRLTEPRFQQVEEALAALRAALQALEAVQQDEGAQRDQALQALHARLAELTAEIEALRAELRSPEAVQQRIAPVLDEAVSDQIRQNRDTFAEVIAPLIGPAIRAQIRHAKEDIINALYPVIGQTIGKAVSEAVRELARNIDARLRRGLDVRTRLRQVWARLRGVSETEFLLREALPFQVQRVFLIHRQTGLLLTHLARDAAQDVDSDVIGGMLTAIRDFVRDAFGRGSGELEEIQHGDTRILLEAGPLAYLAVALEGVEPPGYGQRMRQVVNQINTDLEPALRDFDGDMSRLPDLHPWLEPLFQTAAAEAAAPPLSRGQKLAFSLGALLTLLWLAGMGLLCVMTVRLWPVAFPAATPTATLTATPAATFTPSPTPSPTWTLTPTATPTATMTPSPTPTNTPLPTATATPSPTPAPPTAVLLGTLRVHSEPGLDTPVLTWLPVGEVVWVEAVQGDWALVRWPVDGAAQVRGWVSLAWLQIQTP